MGATYGGYLITLQVAPITLYLLLVMGHQVAPRVSSHTQPPQIPSIGSPHHFILANSCSNESLGSPHWQCQQGIMCKFKTFFRNARKDFVGSPHHFILASNESIGSPHWQCKQGILCKFECLWQSGRRTDFIGSHHQFTLASNNESVGSPHRQPPSL